MKKWSKLFGVVAVEIILITFQACSPPRRPIFTEGRYGSGLYFWVNSANLILMGKQQIIIVLPRNAAYSMGMCAIYTTDQGIYSLALRNPAFRFKILLTDDSELVEKKSEIRRAARDGCMFKSGEWEFVIPKNNRRFYFCVFADRRTVVLNFVDGCGVVFSTYPVEALYRFVGMYLFQVSQKALRIIHGWVDKNGHLAGPSWTGVQPSKSKIQ